VERRTNSREPRSYVHVIRSTTTSRMRRRPDPYDVPPQRTLHRRRAALIQHCRGGDAGWITDRPHRSDTPESREAAQCCRARPAEEGSRRRSRVPARRPS
jgi:hypothetical protein